MIPGINRKTAIILLLVALAYVVFAMVTQGWWV